MGRIIFQAENQDLGLSLLCLWEAAGTQSSAPSGGKRTIYRIVLLFLALIETKNSFLSLRVASPVEGHKLPSCSLSDLLIFFFRAQKIINISLNSIYNLWLLLSLFWVKVSSGMTPSASRRAYLCLGRAPGLRTETNPAGGRFESPCFGEFPQS